MSIALQFLWKYKHWVIAAIIAVTMLIMTAYYQHKNAEFEETILNQSKTIANHEKTIGKLNSDLSDKIKEISLRETELKILSEAMASYNAIKQEFKEIEGKRKDLLEKIVIEKDTKRRAELEALYWNTILGIKAEASETCNKECVKIVPVIKKPVIKKVK